jgi:ATP-dependent helicase/nuclease subunit B
MAVMAEAIETSRRAGRIEALSKILELPGYRRQLAARFAGWTRDERSFDAPPPGDSAVAAEEWAVFRNYREVLRQVGAEDPEGWDVWASTMLAKQPPPELRKPGQVVVIDPIGPDRPAWRLLDYCHQKARSMVVTLPFDHDPSLAELYACVDDARRQFLGWGFVEEPERLDGFSFRAAGLVAIERELFRSDSHERPAIRLDPSQGLKIVGGPKGEGVALLIAREVRALLDRGAHPDEILILVPRMDDEAGRIREALHAWGLPVEGESVGRLAKIAAVSALRLAMRLPVDGWEVATLVRLLRNGQIQRPDLDGASGCGRFEAASAIHATGIFRDRQSLEDALERDRDDPKKGRLAKVAARALRTLGEVIDSTVGPGPWPVQVDRARRLAVALGIEPTPLEPLWDALDDQGWVRDRLGVAIAEESLTWREFVAQVEATVAEVVVPPADPTPGAIRIEAVRDAEGARARFVILANLAERTFPAPEAIDLEVTLEGPATPAGRPDLAFSREMLRFARVSGSADERVILAFPTTDVNGEALLPAGFLDDLIRRLDEKASRECVERHARFDPVLMDHPDLARSSSDARVRAVALATLGEDDGPLRALATDPRHAEGLLGVADGFEVAHRRRVDREFGPYDGRLRDPRAIARIREEFGPDHPFSPSQLESFALCPFQFYQRYVLGLKVVDERRELDEDYAGRGSDVHDVLETIHEQAVAEGETDHLVERLNVLIETHVRVGLEAHEGKPSTVPQVLEEIGDRRTHKSLSRYVGQFRSYFERQQAGPKPHKFEVAFGQQDQNGAESTNSLPHLTIGEADAVVRLQGKIDRIDLVRDEEGKVFFRVIDYKTGSSPSGQDVLAGLASQLPLYALAVEQLLFPDGGPEFGDAGYWSMPKDGFKAVRIKEWSDYRDRLMTFVVDLVSKLREGQFPIESQKKECHKYCDYHAACRVKEVRYTNKVWSGRPTLRDDA